MEANATSGGGSAPQIKVATTDQAMAWISGGWGLFKKAPGMWIAMLVIYFIIAIVANFIPFVGSLALSLFAPVFTIGWLTGVMDVEAGKELTVGHLFAGFRSPRMGSLVILGLLSLAIGAGFALLAGLGVFGMFMGGGTVVQAESLGVGALLLALLVLVTIFLLAAAFLFATPLVGFNGVSPIEAVKLSFTATIKNWLPLLIWSLVALLLTIVGAIPLGLGLLVVFPILGASYYLMYRDVFGAA